MAPVQIVIVGFNNSADIMECLAALNQASPEPGFDVRICENGGPAGYAALLAALQTASDLAEILPLPPVTGADFVARADFRLRRHGATVSIGLAPGNLGYAGGINAWLEPLQGLPDWQGAWILNPDTTPAPDALAALLAEAEASGRGMVGSRIVSVENGRDISIAGLKWNWILASTRRVDGRPGAAPRLHAPSGSSTYITRALLLRIGLPDPRYFLYFEDLEWGFRAALLGEVGYAHASVVRHVGGTTTGMSGDRGKSSPLSVYLNFRNRFAFLRRHRPGWLAWTALMGAGHALRYILWGSSRLCLVALRGLRDGLRGRCGPPEHLDELRDGRNRNWWSKAFY